MKMMASPMSRCRSALFLPASNARAIVKARGLPCDAVVLDLEDSVAPDAKAAARDAARAAVHDGGFGPRLLVVRINAVDGEWAEDDLAALATAPPDAVLLPKVHGVATLRMARERLGADGPAVWAMIETARGIMALPEIASAAAELRLGALVAGTNDLALDLRCRPRADRAPLLPALAQIVAAARAGRMLALDGVLNVFDDPDRLAAECRQAADWGFDGKSLIHPAQIDAANAAFGPTEAEVARARAIVAAFSAPDTEGRGAIRLNGEMVERLHLMEAERVLALAE
jgi:citrate lyase subunit beta/citryl-CoA lyase